MKNRIDIFAQHYCPFHLIVLGVVFFLTSLLLVFMVPPLGIGLLLLSLFLTTTHYRLAIDPSDKKYREYLWVLGFTKGAIRDYDKAEYLYVNQVEHNMEYGIVARLNARKVLYQAYLKLSNGESVYIGEGQREKNILKKVIKISERLGVEIKQNY